MAKLSQTPISYLDGIGEQRAKLFNKLGVDTVGALLRFYPRDYIDFSNFQMINECENDKISILKLTIVNKAKEIRARNSMMLYKGVATDGERDIKFTFFNSKYTAEQLLEDEEYYFVGRLTGGKNSREIISPTVYGCEDTIIKPIYPQTAGLNSNYIEKSVKKAITLLPDTIKDPIPADIREKYTLCHLRYAIENIHQPKSTESLEFAQKRLIFDELLTLQLGLFQMKSGANKKKSKKIVKDYTQDFYKLLPFTPTNAQKKAIEESICDMKSNVAMNRLIQGDVGSGKTAVAAGLCYTIVKNSMQSVLMAPTEILATQHYNSLSALLENSGVRVGLLVGSLKVKEKREILTKIENSEVDLIVGTHALLSDNVKFCNLGLVVTDEQHRFGVTQRAILSQKGEYPHILVMSATPIPRTLALMMYGDLDISILNEMPAGRKKILTRLTSTNKRKNAYDFIKNVIDNGSQAYIVCPLVDENEENPQLMSAEKYAKQLKEREFVGYNVGILHGKQKGKEKDETMAKFAKGEIDLLIATTVIEVGVDVPNAVVMMIENAERFGLSQLHQLRGRVGRGDKQSFCFLISDSKNPKTLQRLKVMTQTTDGFKIADEDLALRGPGDFFGEKQHGLPQLKIANLLENVAVLKEAQATARKLLKDDPTLSNNENLGLKAQTKLLFDKVGSGGFN